MADKRPGHFSIHARVLDLRFNLKVLTMCLVAAASTLGLALWAMTLGEVPLTVSEVTAAVFGEGTPRAELTVNQYRAPRILLAILVGAALAISGAIFQGLVRNELASPDIIGINTGAAAFGFVWLLFTRNVLVLPYVLFAGAIASAVFIYVLSWKGGISTNRLILVGIGFATCLAAFEDFLIKRFPLEDIIWADNLLLGSVARANWGDVRVIAIGLALALPAALLMAWPLRAQQLGDDTARTIGLPVELFRLILMIVGCLLCAVAVAVSGLIGFVALIVPHVARMLAGPVCGSVILLTGLLGGLLVLASDVVGDNFLPVQLPVSVVMGALGAPFFLYMFWRSQVRL
nr:iron ABC transporter permease [Micromonospora sp. DSM 115978]